MPNGRLILFLVLIGLITAVLFSILSATAGNLDSYPIGGDGAQDDGEWLRIIKSPASPYVKRGDTAVFTIIVINTSTQFDMVDVKVTDEQAPGCDNEFEEIRFDAEPPQYTCQQENVRNAFTNEIVVTGKNATNKKPDEASATADIEVLELTAAIDPETSAVPAPGGDMTFFVTLTNRSSVPVILESLFSNQFGDLADPQNEKLDSNTCKNAVGRQLSANSGQYKCEFTTDISNPPGDYLFDVEATATVKNDSDYSVSGDGETEVSIVEIIAATLTTKKSRYASGSLIDLTVTLKTAWLRLH